MANTQTNVTCSFANMEMNLLLAKILWTYELELVNKEVNWLKDGKVHVLWWKPKLFVRFHKRADLSGMVDKGIGGSVQSAP